MARLRKPTLDEPSIFFAPGEARATRTSPRKVTRASHYLESSDEDDSILVPKLNKRGLRNTSQSSQDVENTFSVPSTPMGLDALTPRKQRILRPVESNSRLLRKLSDESLASPEKKQRERRIRSGTTDTDIGKKTNLLYARTLAKSVVRKQASRAQISVVAETELHDNVSQPSRKNSLKDTQEQMEIETVEEAETSLLCEDEDNQAPQEQEMETETQQSSDEEEEDPVVASRHRQRRPQARCVPSDSEDDEYATSAKGQDTQMESMEQEIPMPMRPPHRMGPNTISTWAQEVVDLTGSPEPPASFEVAPLPAPDRARSASFASSHSQTSASNGGHAVLTYSPTPKKSRSPCKAPPIDRPSTPPFPPSSPSKLVSPSKKRPAIPKAPDLRPSLDAFWNPEVVHHAHDLQSPEKPLVSPRKQKWRDDIVKMMDRVDLDDESESDTDFPSPTTSPRKKDVGKSRSPAKKITPSPVEEQSTKAIRAQRKDFAEKKHALAESFLVELDTTISEGRISTLSKQTGGIKLIWSKTLKTTAGRANWKREQIRIRTGPSPTDFKLEIRHHCSIELAEKVIDDQNRLYNVLAHEFCHLTTFMISEVRNNPHGAEFKSWGRQATAAFAHLGVEVTTKHSYDIEYKYIWECLTCSYPFKRHSKSIDPARHSCGKCKGRLVQIKPVPRQQKAVSSTPGQADDPNANGKGKSEYQVFVKEHFGRVKARLEAESKGEKVGMGKVMEVLGREYREMKAEKAQKEKDTSVGEVKGLEEALAGLGI